MKITEVRALYPTYRQSLKAWRPYFWQIVVRVETDVGVVGWGYGGGGVAGVEVVNRHLRELLLDREIGSTADILAIWDDLYAATLPYGRKGIAIMALSGVDLALWDLLARAENVPVYRLIGPLQKERIRCYATSPDTEWVQEQGFTAHKHPFQWQQAADYDRAEDAVSRSRALLGEDALVMLDGYMTWDATVVREMACRLRPYDVYWFEDILTPDQLAEHAPLRPEIAPIHVAGGEHEFTHYGFAEIARADAMSIWQPDSTWCGGVTALLRIVELAQEAGAQVVPHRGGEVWGLHVIAATACDDLAELVIGTRNAQPDPLWLDEPQPVDGFLQIPDTPGFGVRVNEELL